jgi:hypothetical protein
MIDELAQTATFVPLTDIEMGRILRWARLIEVIREIPIDSTHGDVVAKLEKYSNQNT